MIRTFDNRVSIQFVAINDDVDNFHSVFNSRNARYILLSVSLIISIFIIAGKTVEMIRETLNDNRVLQLNSLLKVIGWITLELIKKTLYL